MTHGGRPRKYSEDVLAVVKVLWKVSEMPCGNRFKAVVPEWLDHYDRREGPLEQELRTKGGESCEI